MATTAHTDYDLLVIGAGPGGYVAAIRAAQLGMRVACVEKEPKLGGTCLRVGCIPSKTLLEATEKYHLAKEEFHHLGIACEKVTVDLPTLMARKNKIVETLSNGIGGLFKKNKITRLTGAAGFASASTVNITSAEGKQTVSARKILIATGSEPASLPNIPFDGKYVISSDQAIALPAVPEKLVVIGAGAIGLELSSVWRRLGAQVTVLEIHHTTLPGSDDEMGRHMERVLKGQGIEFIFASAAVAVKLQKDQVVISYKAKDAKPDQPAHNLTANLVLVAVGRKAYTTGLELDKAGIATDSRGRITVAKHWETSVPNIYAIGDVIVGPMLAHKAEDEGVAVVERMAGIPGHVNYDTIPFVVYTAPELAWVGKTEEELKAANISYKTGKFRFSANSRALCMDETQGMVKILADARTDMVLGVHILGPQASTMIAEAVIAMELGASSEDIARTCHAHPTLPEAMREAAMAVDGRTINS